MAKMESGSGSDTGLIALLIQINKALHRRTSEELLGMRLKQFLLLGYAGDRGAVSQQELETGLVMDANSVVLLLNETEAAGFLSPEARPGRPPPSHGRAHRRRQAGSRAGREGSGRESRTRCSWT